MQCPMSNFHVQKNLVNSSLYTEAQNTHIRYREGILIEDKLNALCSLSYLQKYKHSNSCSIVNTH